MMALAQRAMGRLEEVYSPHGYNVGFNQGRVAGAGVEHHIHMHVVPRWAGDNNFMPVIADTKVMPQIHRAELRGAEGSVLSEQAPLAPAGIFKAYDIRGLYGEEMDETHRPRDRPRLRPRARRGCAARQPSELRVGLGRDMRLTAPAMAAELREGLIAEGATVLDAGMVATEMLYHLVGSRELDGGAMVTASHNPKAYTGVKLVREGALPLSGDAGIGDVKAEIEAGLGRRARRRLLRGGRRLGRVPRPRALLHRPRQREADEGRRRRRQRDGRADGRADPREAAAGAGGDVLRARRRVPRPRAEPAAGGEPAADHRAGARRPAPTSGSPGTATPTAASSSTAAASSATATSSAPCWPARRWPRTPARRSSTTPAPAARCRTWSRPRAAAPTSRRVGHAFFKARMREEQAVFGGEVSGHYYFRDFWNADSGTIPALLMLELLSLDGRGARRADGRVPLQVLHLRRDQLRGRRPGGEDGGDRRALRRRARSPRSTGSRSTTRTGTSTCAPPTPSRCCASTSSRWSRARTWSAAATRSSG